jgi:hypothetical protein
MLLVAAPACRAWLNACFWSRQWEARHAAPRTPLGEWSLFRRPLEPPPSGRHALTSTVTPLL